MNLADAARTGTGVGLQLTPAQQEVFSAGVQALTAGAARALAGGYDPGRDRRDLDVGGGTGSFLVALSSAHPQLEATLFELPAAAVVARRVLTGTPVADRVSVAEGNFLREPQPSGHDLLLVANVLHLFEPQVNQELLGKLRAAALMAAEFLVIAAGDVYSADEVLQSRFHGELPFVSGE